MNRNFSQLFTLLAAAVGFSAGLQADTTSINGGIGYRQDSISWKSHGRGNVNPKTHSNLHFEDLEICFLGVEGRTTFGSSPAYFKLGFDYGWVLDGRLREALSINTQRRASQHAGSSYNDSGEFFAASVHNNVRRHSFVWDLDFKLGYPFQCGCDGFSVAPTVGFLLNRQQIRVHGHTVLSEANEVPFDGEDCVQPKNHGSHFRFSAWGPYVGLDFAYVLPTCWTAYGEIEVHFGKIRRDRESHTDYAHIDSLRRTKSFWGPSFKLGANYLLDDCWYIDASIYYSKFLSTTNRDKYTWSTGNIRLDAGYVF